MIEDGEARLADNAGIVTRQEEGKVLIDQIVFGTPAEGAGLDFDWEITAVQTAAQRMPKETFYLPALVLLGLIVLLQRRRRDGGNVAAQAAA